MLISGVWMRRPLFLAIVGVSIVVSAISIGTALTGYLSLRSYSPKAPPGAAVAAAEPGTAPPPVEEWKNPFSPAQGMKIPSRLPAAAKGGGATVSRTNFILVGTIASSTPSARRAVLWADGMKEPRAYRESEEVEPGAVLASVERDRIWLVRGGEREKLDLLPVGSKARPTAATAAPAAPRAAAAPSSPLPASPPAVVASPDEAEDKYYEQQRKKARARQRR
jgi:hypothetical protein